MSGHTRRAKCYLLRLSGTMRCREPATHLPPPILKALEADHGLELARYIYRCFAECFDILLRVRQSLRCGRDQVAGDKTQDILEAHGWIYYQHPEWPSDYT